VLFKDTKSWRGDVNYDIDRIIRINDEVNWRRMSHYKTLPKI